MFCAFPIWLTLVASSDNPKEARGVVYRGTSCLVTVVVVGEGVGVLIVTVGTCGGAHFR